MAEWLDYGAIGLVALILMGIGAGASKFLDRLMDNQKAALNHQAEAGKEQAALEAQRRAAGDKFLQDLIQQDRAERAETLQAMQSLVAQDIEAKQALAKTLDGVTGALGELCERQDRHERRADERHQQMLLLFRQNQGFPE